MKYLRLLLIVAFVLGFASLSFAIPQLNTANDGFEDRSDTTAFAYWQNSGDFLFLASGNNLGNATTLAQVQSLVRNAVGDQNLILTFADVISTNYNNDGTINTGGATDSGTWITNPSSDTIEFYAVKAADAFAMYRVSPAEGTGSWSTFDLWQAGYGGHPRNGGGGLQISHFTGYNPGSTSVPEPGMLMLFGSGLLGLGLFGRRKFGK